MEQVVAAELGEVEAASRAGIKIVALAPHGKSALFRGSGRFARGAIHHALQIPVAFRAVEHPDLAAFGVDQDEPFCRAAFRLGPFREELVYLVKSLPNATFAEQVRLSIDSAVAGGHGARSVKVIPGSVQVEPAGLHGARAGHEVVPASRCFCPAFGHGA